MVRRAEVSWVALRQWDSDSLMVEEFAFARLRTGVDSEPSMRYSGQHLPPACFSDGATGKWLLVGKEAVISECVKWARQISALAES